MLRRRARAFLASAPIAWHAGAGISTMRLAAAFFLLLLSAGFASAERRVALVIGVDRYETLRPLANAVNDAPAPSRICWKGSRAGTWPPRRARRAAGASQADR